MKFLQYENIYYRFFIKHIFSRKSSLLLNNRTAYQYHINGSDHSSPEHRPLPNRRLNSNGITVVNKETEVKSARQFEALKQQRRLGTRGSIDSGGSGVSSPMSLSDTATEHSAMQQVMA